MLLALNPNDNHGIREHLSCAYLTRGWPDKTIELTERYPSDFCGPALNGILALVTVGREAEARDELLVAMEEHGVALRMLLAESPGNRKPTKAPVSRSAGSKNHGYTECRRMPGGNATAHLLG